MNSEDHNRTAVLDEPPPKLSKAAATREAVNAHHSWDDEDDGPTGFRKYRAPIIVGVLTAAGIAFAAMALSKKDTGQVQAQEVTQVRLMLPPLPPPPPPPPPPEAAKEEKMIEEKEEEEAPPDPSPQVDTAVKGPGAGGMQIKAGNSAGFFANRKSVDEAARARSAYAMAAKSRIMDALRSNPRTRKASLRIDIRIWPDQTGRITKASIAASSGDTALDATIRDEILTGLQLSTPPPAGMPTPIVMRVIARRPS
jgi:periplasmic protein TonB